MEYTCYVSFIDSSTDYSHEYYDPNSDRNKWYQSNKDEDKQSGSQGYPTPTVKSKEPTYIVHDFDFEKTSPSIANTATIFNKCKVFDEMSHPDLKRKCLVRVVESGTMPPKAPLILQQSVEGATATAFGVEKITSNVNEEKAIIFDPGGAVLGDDGYGEMDTQEFQITKVARMGDKHLLPVKNRQDKVEEHCLATKEGCESPFESLVHVISNLEWSRGCDMVIDIDTRRQLGPTTSVSSNKSIQFRTLGKVVTLQGIGQEVSANIFVARTNLLYYWGELLEFVRMCWMIIMDQPLSSVIW